MLRIEDLKEDKNGKLLWEVGGLFEIGWEFTSVTHFSMK